jgi:calcineurin-like phosphoesterase family protein
MRFPHLALSVVLVSLSTVAFAQSDAHTSADRTVPSDAQTSFDKLKTLAGSWEGRMNVVPPVPDVEGKSSQVTFRVASRGHTLMHDLKVEGMPDNPITMLVVDGDRLLLTHYCDADNRPRMVARMSADGKIVEFDFLDVSGNLAHGHMHHAVFTFLDQDHHTEDWTYMMPGDKPIRAHFDLHRTAGASAGSGK